MRPPYRRGTEGPRDCPPPCSAAGRRLSIGKISVIWAKPSLSLSKRNVRKCCKCICEYFFEPHWEPGKILVCCARVLVGYKMPGAVTATFFLAGGHFPSAHALWLPSSTIGRGGAGEGGMRGSWTRAAFRAITAGGTRESPGLRCEKAKDEWVRPEGRGGCISR